MLESFKIKVLLKKADSLFNQEKYDDSLIYYEKILSLNNNHIKSLYKKALVFYLKDSYKESLKTLESIYEFDNCEEALLLMGRISFLIGEYENAINYYKLSLDVNIFKYGKYVDEFLFFGDVKYKYVSSNYLEFSNFSLDLCDLLLEKFEDEDTKLWKAYKLHSLGRNEESLELLDNLNDVSFNNPLFYFLKSSIFLDWGMYEQSLKYSEKALYLDSNDVLSILVKAKDLYYLGNFKDALYYFNKANLIEDISDSYLFISKINIKEENWIISLENINKAIMIEKKYNGSLKKEFSIVYNGKDFYDLFFYKSLILFKLKRFHDANDICDCLLEKDESAKNYCLKSMILFEMDDYENALMFVNKALGLKPDCKQAIELKEKIETL